MRVLVSALMAGLFTGGLGESFELAPGAVVLGDTVFLTAADGSLAAHDASTGALRWASPDARRPLAGHGARLLAQAPADEGLRLVILDAATGRRVGATDIALPAPVTAPLDETGDTRFLIRAEQAGADVRIAWTWEYRPMRGAFVEEQPDGGLRQVRGAVRVDLAAGRFAPAQAPAEGLVALPDALAGEADKGAFRERPLPIAGWWVATQAAPGGAVLKRWTGNAAPLPDAALPADLTLQIGSADGRHVLVSREARGRAAAQAPAVVRDRARHGRPRRHAAHLDRRGRLRGGRRPPAGRARSLGASRAVRLARRAAPPGGVRSRRAPPPGRKRCAIPRITAPWPRRRAP